MVVLRIDFFNPAASSLYSRFHAYCALKSAAAVSTGSFSTLSRCRCWSLAGRDWSATGGDWFNLVGTGSDQ